MPPHATPPTTTVPFLSGMRSQGTLPTAMPCQQCNHLRLGVWNGDDTSPIPPSPIGPRTSYGPGRSPKLSNVTHRQIHLTLQQCRPIDDYLCRGHGSVVHGDGH